MKLKNKIKYSFILISNILFAQNKKQLEPYIPNQTFQNIQVCSLLTNNNQVSNHKFLQINSTANDQTFNYPNGTNLGCLEVVYNQKYFIITINNNPTGPIKIIPTNSSNVDIDAAIWGPLQLNDSNAACLAMQNQPISCDFNPDPNPVLTINNAQNGQKYILLISNYANSNTTIYLNQGSNADITYSYLDNSITPMYVHTSKGLKSCYDFQNNVFDKISSNNANYQNLIFQTDRYNNTNNSGFFNNNLNSFASVSNPNHLKFRTYTYSMWIKPNILPQNGQSQWIFNIGQNFVGDQAIRIVNNNNNIYFASHAYANPAGCIPPNMLNSSNSGVQIEANKWYYLTVTMDNNNYNMYLNGNLVSTLNTYCSEIEYGNSTSMHFGNRFGIYFPFSGNIDDFRIYNRSLNSQEIKNIMRTRDCLTDCPESLTISNNLISEFKDRREAIKIESSSTILNLANIRFDAKETIELTPGFTAQNGGVFEAIISGCGGEN